jgi:arylsulfatase A-like enzyme
MISWRREMESNYNRRDFLKLSGMSLAALSMPNINFGKFSANPDRPNVLFIPVDDLRPQLGCYGQSHVISPNFDRLANEGMLFERAYCQMPISMSSRASLLTGFRPDHNNLYNCTSVEELGLEDYTINRQFTNAGYDAWATGKIFHHENDHRRQFPNQWKNLRKEGWYGRGYVKEESKRIVDEYAIEYPKIKNGALAEGRGPAWEDADVPDNGYVDGYRTDLVIEQLKNFGKGKSPFFMAVGFRKPHLAFNAPKKYWDMYETDQLELADNPFLPENYTEFTKYNFPELRNYYGIPKDDKPLPESIARKLIHGYHACVTYIDAQLGRILDELERLKLRENTIIVMWGDHGWKLGEHGMWCKHTPFELDCRVPLMFSYPGMKNAGSKTDKLVECVDIYPTLCDLAGLNVPDHCQGDTLKPLMENPTMDWKPAAFTQWPPNNRKNPDKVITGYSMKTDRYRYTEWTRNKTGEVLNTELYDHFTDPKENINIAGTADKQLVDKLSVMLDGGKGWRKFHADKDKKKELKNG